jgi:hypothetical protein
MPHPQTGGLPGTAHGARRLWFQQRQHTKKKLQSGHLFLTLSLKQLIRLAASVLLTLYAAMLGSVCEKRSGNRHLKVDCKAREGRGGEGRRRE